MESTFNQLLKETVTPLMKDAGFRKTALNYYRQGTGMVYMINVQKSQSNSVAETGFYINCGVHSPEIEEALGGSPNPMPKEYQCHFRCRIQELSSEAHDKYVIDSQTDLKQLQGQLEKSLSEALAVFESLSAPYAFVQFIAHHGTEKQFELFRYCLRMGYLEEANMLKAHVRKMMGEERWEEFFKERFGEIEGEG